MLSLVKNEVPSPPPTPRTPALHGGTGLDNIGGLHSSQSPPHQMTAAAESSPPTTDRPESPEIDVDSPDDSSGGDGGGVQLPPPLSPRDIKEEEDDEDDEEEEDRKPNLGLPANLLAPLALHLHNAQQRPPVVGGGLMSHHQHPAFPPLFQPFLPMPPLLRHPRSVPFSIDAILRPDFGNNRLSPPVSLSPPSTRLSPPPPKPVSKTPAVSPPRLRESSRLEAEPGGAGGGGGKKDGKPTADGDCPPGFLMGKIKRY